MSRGHSAKVSESSKMPQPDTSHLLQQKLAARQTQRAAKAAERQKKSDTLKEEGNAFFRNGDFHRALESYQRAINVHGPSQKPVLLANLAATYLKLEMYYEAHEAADKALTADPTSVKARYRRGMARKYMEMWLAADIDFRTVLTLDPENRDAQAELAYVEQRRCEMPPWEEEEEVASYSDHEAPTLEDDPQLGDSLSESSDCEHTGNGIPCKFYNRTECRQGDACRYSHAPDSKSERDALGRNVCRYYLMGVCKFGERCSYSHSKEYLLHRGWWSTTESIERERKQYNVIQMFNKAIADHDKQVKASATGPKSKKKKPSKGKKRGPRAPLGGSKPADYSHSTWGNYDSDDEYEGGMCGFTRSQVNELISYGVKPWDDEAWDVLDAVHSYY